MANQTLDTEADEDLTDVQIEQLLARASARLKANANSAVVLQDRPQNQFSFPKLETGDIAKSYITSTGEVAEANASRLVNEKQRKQAGEFRKVEDPVASKRFAIEKKKATAGTDWYNLPKTDLTPELKRDLQLLKMRNVLDPHRHYKKDGGKMKAPEYSQVGTIIEGATEFYSGRIENKKRQRTFVEEVLAGEQETGRFTRKYGEVQSKKASGKKSFYKTLQSKRKNGVTKGG